jgi:ribosomal protein L29
MKKASKMSPAEREAALAEIKQAARTFEPMPTDKKARDMTAQERAEWLAEHKRRFA